jgi:hypothetical protein
LLARNDVATSTFSAGATAVVVLPGAGGALQAGAAEPIAASPTNDAASKRFMILLLFVK